MEDQKAVLPLPMPPYRFQNDSSVDPSMLSQSLLSQSSLTEQGNRPMTKTLVEELRANASETAQGWSDKLMLSAASRIEELEKAMEGLVDDLERRHRQVAEVCDEMQQQANDGYSYHRLVGKQAAYHHAAELAYQALSYKG